MRVHPECEQWRRLRVVKDHSRSKHLPSDAGESFFCRMELLPYAEKKDQKVLPSNLRRVHWRKSNPSFVQNALRRVVVCLLCKALIATTLVS